MLIKQILKVEYKINGKMSDEVEHFHESNWRNPNRTFEEPLTSPISR